MDIAENKLCHLENQQKFPEYNKKKETMREDQTWLIDLEKSLSV